MDTLPTMVPGDDDPRPSPLEVIEMSLPGKTIAMLMRRGLTAADVLQGRVPGLDPQKILDAAAHEDDSS